MAVPKRRLEEIRITIVIEFSYHIAFFFLSNQKKSIAKRYFEEKNFSRTVYHSDNFYKYIVRAYNIQNKYLVNVLRIVTDNFVRPTR